MAAFLVRSNLSRGDLRLFLSNSNGYAQDASSVKWTVYARDGRQVSGRNLPAIRKEVGQYYAPWFTDVPNGNYKVIWEITQEFGGPAVKLTDFIFVVDPADYPCGRPINKDAVPAQGQFTFLSGQGLGPGDLPLYLKNDGGFPQDAFCVFFTILDAVGNCAHMRALAANCGVGVYYAPYFVNLCSGNYTVLWEWQTVQGSPLKSARVGFSVIDTGAPYSFIVPIVCSSSLFSQGCAQPTRPILTRVLLGQCDPCGGGGCGAPPLRHEPCPSFIPPPFVPPCPPFPPCPPKPANCCEEIPRTIHLLTQPLPPSGNFTNQPPYLIPDCIRKIAFYVTYAYGAPGGYAIVQLRWGNGTEESSETLIDHSINVVEPNSFQNLYLQSMNGPTPANSSPITFIIEAVVPGGAKTVRLIATEGGNPGIAGTCGITLTASSD